MSHTRDPFPIPRAIVPFGWRDFATKYCLLRREEGMTPRLAGEFSARLALWSVSQATWLLDNLVAPGWARTDVEAPLFIIGHQRSGTTLLHRILAADRTHARALTLQEMLLPAVSFQRGLAMLHAADQRLGAHAARAIESWQEKRLGPMDNIHRLRLHEIEEDEFVFWAIFASAMCVNDAPSTAANPALDTLRNFYAWPETRQRAVLGWYRACLMKKLHREPPLDGPAWIVAKNPAFSQKIPCLREFFPDARFIHLHRDPMETIPSRLSLIRAIARQRFQRDLDLTPEHIEAVINDSIQTYARAQHDLKAVPDSDQLTIPYTRFIQDPPGAIQKIYDHFHLPSDDPTLQNTLAQQSSPQETKPTKHHYTLKEFGLSPETLQTQLNTALSQPT